MNPLLQHKGCRYSEKNRILPGYGNHTLAVGASMWTHRTPLTKEIYSDYRCTTGKGGSIKLPIDLWVKCLDHYGIIKVGQMCPYYFIQGATHCASDRDQSTKNCDVYLTEERYLEGDFKVEHKVKEKMKTYTVGGAARTKKGKTDNAKAA